MELCKELSQLIWILVILAIECANKSDLNSSIVNANYMHFLKIQCYFFTETS